MRLLILGGTVFLGRAVTDYALERGHQVTHFNRGKSNPSLYPDVETIHGNRDGELGMLSGRTFDAVIDTCGYFPRVVNQSVEALRDSAGIYAFVSSLSVYNDNSVPGADETSTIGTIEDESVEEITGETYGPLKALCESVAERTFGERALIVRPGLIVGPHDPSDRFTYWVDRTAAGGDVLAPGNPDRRIQFIDVRDLGEWMVRMIESNRGGTFNAIGPEPPVTMGDLLGTCRNVCGNDARFNWVSEEFLEANNVGAWMEMPLWLPEPDTDLSGFFYWSNSRAVDAGMTFRSLEDTVRATLEWSRTRPTDRKQRAGMASEREQELLKLWNTR